MAYAVMSRKFLRYENELSVERMEICVDTASDLPTADGITGCKIAQGSIAWDVSTGDFYGMSSTGEWINQSGGANAVQTLELTAEDYPVAVESEVTENDTMGGSESAEAGVQ
ncbi:hypothetical protein [Ruminococcus champanellensis]|uniref:hypothetical protein n=1 Tax=Ruminococcus champanellensis TaxID=1161942 RepID=UPI0023F55A11|nr:hypothetical protein [Ruminococcus champanellensis]